jgi:hypothetical protein
MRKLFRRSYDLSDDDEPGETHPETDNEKIRLESPKFGTVYAWHPEYRGDLNHVVVYFHGHADWSVDDFWKNGDLRNQFQRSGLKALFIVPESAKNNGDKKQTNVNGILEFVQKETGIDTDKNITVVAHSGGGFTVPYWIQDKRVKNVILLDALDKTEQPLHNWLKTDERRLILVASVMSGYRSRNEDFAKEYDSSKSFTEIPEDPDSETLSAKVIRVETKESHSSLVYNKKQIPAALKFLASCNSR